MADRGPVEIVLVCEDTLERAGLNALLGGRSGMKIVGEAFSLADLPQLAVELNPDIILDVEYSLDSRTVDSAAKMIRYIGSVTSSRFIILTSSPGEFGIELMRSGNCALLDKKIGYEELVAAIRMAVAGYIPVKEKLMVSLARAAIRLEEPEGAAAGNLDLLTRQERKVLMLIIQGLSNPEIAADLTLAESTVKSHVQGILKKLGLRDRVHIIIYAYERGLIGRLRQASASLLFPGKGSPVFPVTPGLRRPFPRRGSSGACPSMFPRRTAGMPSGCRLA